MREIDLARWKRRQHFEFFRDFDDPFWGMTAMVDACRLAETCRRPDGPSFFLASYFLALRALNDVPELRTRIRGEKVIELDLVHGGCTVLRPDETFVFAYLDYHPDPGRFYGPALEAMAEAKRGDGALRPRPDRDDLVHCSSLPWSAMTGFTHARHFAGGDSVPKLVFGGLHRGPAGAENLPVSLTVHHALADGLHVGRFLERYQLHLDDRSLLDALAEAARAAEGP